MVLPRIQRAFPKGTRLTSWLLRLEQNVGIIAVSVPAIRPLFSRVFKIGVFGSLKTPPKYGPSSEFGMELGNMNGRSKGGVSQRATTIVSAARQTHYDDNGSESSLVKEVSNDKIIKRVSVELHVRSTDPADPETGLGQEEKVRGSWLRD